jgi:hypothetical protein
MSSEKGERLVRDKSYPLCRHCEAYFVRITTRSGAHQNHGEPTVEQREVRVGEVKQRSPEPKPAPVDVLGGLTPAEASARGKAATAKVALIDAWLREVLSSGPVPYAEIKERAEKQGLSDATLSKARDRIGATHRWQATSGKHGGRASVWYLPEPRSEPQSEPEKAPEASEKHEPSLHTEEPPIEAPRPPQEQPAATEEKPGGELNPMVKQLVEMALQLAGGSLAKYGFVEIAQARAMSETAANLWRAALRQAADDLDAAATQLMEMASRLRKL